MALAPALQAIQAGVATLERGSPPELEEDYGGLIAGLGRTQSGGA